MKLKLTPHQKADIFKALSHPVRLLVAEKLAQKEQCVSDLLALFDIDVSTLSRHLAVMRNAGVVRDEKRGKNVYYSLVCNCVLGIGDCFEKC